MNYCIVALSYCSVLSYGYDRKTFGVAGQDLALLLCRYLLRTVLITGYDTMYHYCTVLLDFFLWFRLILSFETISMVVLLYRRPVHSIVVPVCF